MKKLLIILLLLVQPTLLLLSQPTPKQKQPTGADMDKLMEEAMKGMTEEEKVQMRKLMKDVMPAVTGQNNATADYPAFTNNRELVPAKDAARISAVQKRSVTQAGISSYANNLYTKLMAKGDATEMALVKKVIAQTPKANDIGAAAILAMLQGHAQAALALSMKAVQADPTNLNWQNNMASLLTQYGYPEQAIPVLRKLNNELPSNSTVLNNLAHAWLNLGETDSARYFAGRAARINPNHPEAKQCSGVIEELKGDPVKAAKEYEEALVNAPNPFTESILKNANGSVQSQTIDFEKLRKSIAIYEYFPRNWVKDIPLLSGNVRNYATDKSIQDGYEKMDEQFNDKLEVMTNTLSKELEALAEKGEDEFVKQLASEMIKGLNFMSKPAALVSILLHQYGAQLTLQLSEDMKGLVAKIDSYKKEYDRATKNASKCEVYEAAANRLMQSVNPMVKKFYLDKAEEYRQWLNALATWNWYIVGNPKNTVLIQDLGYTAMLETLYLAAIKDQLVYAPTCKHQDELAPATIPEPEIPNFTCPAVVSIPVGSDWQQLVAASKDFDKNLYAIKKIGAAPIPNSSIGFGAGTMVAQPGNAPFIKTANGSITPGQINTADDELVPLPNLPDENDPVPLPDLRKNKLGRDLLNKMMTADCKNVRNSKDILKEQLDRMMKSVKELDAYTDMKEQIKKMSEAADQMEAEADRKEQVKKQIEKMQQEADKMDSYEQLQQSKKEMERLMKEMDAMDDKKLFTENQKKVQQLVEEMEGAPSVLKDIRQNGLQASISSGLQSPGTFSPVKGLFQ